MIATVAILAGINLINYIDRYTIAGVLLDVKDYYKVSQSELGLLQTSFIVSYMIFSPIFGYLGDRYNRKIIMAGGIFFWSLITLAGSFIPHDMFWLFLLMRALVGVGEASYSTIAPTIIADLFVNNKRTIALSIFYFAIPVGSGLGYIVGAQVAKALGAWQWALRCTPAIGILCVILIMAVVREPPRGAAEGSTHLTSTSWGADLRYLFTHKSFMLSSLGFTCVAFVAGALALWAPTYMFWSMKVAGSQIEESTVSLTFGVITCFAGLAGVGIGSTVAAKLRPSNPRADPLVCAFGLIASSPFLMVSLYISRHSANTTWGLIFLGETLLSLNWALVTDILLYIVVPNRRSSAEAVQILLSHALGDAGSPYLVGAVSDGIISSRGGLTHFVFENYLSMQYALYMTCFVCVLGGFFFLLTALFLVEDREKVDKVIKAAREAQQDESASSSNSDIAIAAQNHQDLHAVDA